MNRVQVHSFGHLEGHLVRSAMEFNVGRVLQRKVPTIDGGREIARNSVHRLGKDGHFLCSAVITQDNDDAVLALLSLGLHEGQRTWKTFDWDAMHRLHAKGLIQNPVNKDKSVVLTSAGLQQSALLAEQLFAARQPPTTRGPGKH